MKKTQAKQTAINVRQLTDEELSEQYSQQLSALAEAEAVVCGFALEQMRRLIKREYPTAHTAALGVDDWDGESLLFLDTLYDSQGQFIDFDGEKLSSINSLIANLERCYGQEEILLAIDPTDQPLLIQN